MAEEHPSWAELEPAAITKGRGREAGYAPGEPEIELSKAISLKRIADALTGDKAGERIGINIAGELEQIGFSVGQQIKRGMEAG